MKIQWLGHSAFKITGERATVLVDPFLTGNPRFTGTLEGAMDGVTHLFLTHGHGDHFGDTIEILRQTGATFVSTHELAGYVGGQVPDADCVGMNIGGTFHSAGVSVSMVQAFHSSGYQASDGTWFYGGMPAGYVIDIDGHKIYHMGDTGIFSDMGLINELHKPDIGIVPIGDHFTMDPGTAALAVNRFFTFQTVIPCHYLTFPLLAQSADDFVAGVKSADVLVLDPMGEADFKPLGTG